MTSVQEANKRVVQRAYDAWDKGSEATFDEVYAKDVIHRNMAIEGVSDLKEILQRWLEAFPDQTHEVHHTIAEDDWVATRFSMTGTHLGRWREIEPTGSEFEVEGMAMERVEDGKIVERWLIEDMLDFYQKLGLVSGDPVRQNIALVRSVFDGFNTQDREAVAGALAQDFVYGDWNAETFVDVEFAYFVPFPDLTYAVHDIFGSGKMVTSRWSFIGTHQGRGGPWIFQDAEPTGKKVDVPGISIARVEDGKIVQWWGQWDSLMLHRQLGTIEHLVE
jgi:steroid delta-isomerase-like uncharacterized protein